VTGARRIAALGAVLGSSLIAWGSLSVALQSVDPWRRGALLTIPGLAFATLAWPALARRWWVRSAASLSIWGLAFYGAVSLYYPLGDASRACAVAGFGAGAALTAIALVAKSRTVGRDRWIWFAGGLLWVVGGALVGLGVDLNLDRPFARPRPGRTFLWVGVVVWHLPFALFRMIRAEAKDASTSNL
jgi:hypothetical protein